MPAERSAASMVLMSGPPWAIGGQTELKVEPFGNVRHGAGRRWAPRRGHPRAGLDIHEEDDHVLVLVELPGVAKENVELKVVDGRLEFSARARQDDLPQGGGLAAELHGRTDELGVQQRHPSSAI